MSVVHGIDALEPRLGRLFVVVGVFDGLHRGHHYLLHHLVHEARHRAARPAVITFDHHPDEILTGTAPPLLCDPAERLLLLERAGVAVTVVQTFDRTLRMTPFDEFIDRIASRVDLAGFLMTTESAFGHDRGGTPAAVAAHGLVRGYDVVVVTPLEVDGRTIRSADIRVAIAEGRLADAATLLESELPVALPPDGTWPARIVVPGRAGALTRHLTIASGRVRIEPAVDVTDGTRLHARLPVRSDSANLRRS